MRTRIKICGMTRTEDALCAVENGADALGFILVPESPRYVTPEVANQIGFHIPPFVTRVAVIQDINRDTIAMLPRVTDTIQYYTNTRQIRTYPASRTRRVRAYRIKNEASLDEIAETCQEASAILLDTYHKDKLGGSGETFNWELAVEAKQRFGLPIILAGGLTPENVGEAVRKVRPYAVDVSSGVETSPGIKDHKRIAAFCRAVREADLS